MASSAPVLLFLLGLLAVSTHAQKSCYAINDNPYLHFASKTAYEFIKDNAKPEDIPDCEPAQLWMLSRHGTRYPDRKDITEMKALNEIRNQIIRNHDERQDGFLCDEDLKNLKKWSLEVSVVQAEDLTNQGHMDMEFIARRYKTRFPALLTQSYDTQLFNFRYTDTQRTRASAEAFAMGLFGGEEGTIPLPAPYVNDTLIAAYKNCTTWQNDVNEAPESLLERDLFVNGTLVQKVIQDVSERLGFKYKLTMKQIGNMYDMCRFDKAWSVNELSPWCAAFNRTELQVLEYVEDLKYYYQQGYGNQLNIKLGCPPVQDLMRRFSKLETSIDDQPVGVFYFTHSTAIHTTLAALGIARDIVKPMHSNYELMQKREWKISQIGPFASNIAAVFFKCSKGDPNRIMFFLEEAIVPYEGCNVGLCSWSFIKEKFAKLTSECNLDWCSGNTNSSPLNGANAVLFVSVAAILSLRSYL